MKLRGREKNVTPKEIAEEIIWKGLEKDTGDKVSNVYRVCMDIQHYIIDWAKKEKKERRGIIDFATGTEKA